MCRLSAVGWTGRQTDRQAYILVYVRTACVHSLTINMLYYSTTRSLPKHLTTTDLGPGQRWPARRLGAMRMSWVNMPSELYVLVNRGCTAAQVKHAGACCPMHGKINRVNGRGGVGDRETDGVCVRCMCVCPCKILRDDHVPHHIPHHHQTTTKSQSSK